MEPDQFEALVERRRGWLKTLFTSLGVDDPDRIEDLIQETQIAAWRGWARFDGHNLTGWLSCIARNELKDLLRRERRQAPLDELPIDDSDPRTDPRDQDVPHDPEAVHLVSTPGHTPDGVKRASWDHAPHLWVAVDPSPSVIETILHRAELGEVLATIQTLPRIHRQAVLIAALERAPKQTAAQIGLHPVTLRSRTLFGRRLLAAQLAEETPDDPASSG